MYKRLIRFDIRIAWPHSLKMRPFGNIAFIKVAVSLASQAECKAFINCYQIYKILFLGKSSNGVHGRDSC
jgi:hypothetical protein